MVTRNNLPHAKPQDRKKHPSRWEPDLSSEVGAVETRGTARATQPMTRPASEVKRVVRMLQDFERDELQEIPIVEPGSPLRGHSIYVDLHDARRTPFKAVAGSRAGADSLLVPKASVAYGLWNRLVRVAEPERDRGVVGRSDDRGAKSGPRKAARTLGAKGTLSARSRGDTTTRNVSMGDRELHGGRERSERRGGSAVNSVHAAARHRRARSH